ncbi:DUF7660 family protein [Streptomyces thermospinosisporus]|uniref:DUF7660 family protein n=1 Tax=Streptomyces thermospinosisporus TaxID=161482 RepID=UPI003CD080AD
MTSPLGPDDHIDDREAFSAFLAHLRADYAVNGRHWENATLDRFLAGLEAWVTASPGWYRNFGHDLPADGDLDLLRARPDRRSSLRIALPEASYEHGELHGQAAVRRARSAWRLPDLGNTAEVVVRRRGASLSRCALRHSGTHSFPHTRTTRCPSSTWAKSARKRGVNSGQFQNSEPR